MDHDKWEGRVPRDMCGAEERDLEPLLRESIRVVQFDKFISGVRDLVDRNAAKKGYNDSGAEGKNDLFDFCNKFFPGHSLGEIVYKAVRYSKKRNKEDLLKIAAWAYLEWLHDKTEATL